MEKAKSRLDVKHEELIEAINDPSKAEALMKSRGWTKKELMARADLLAKELAAGIAAINVV